MITVTATLRDIFGAVDPGGQVALQLCGFGSLVPRIVGTGMLAKVAPIKIAVDNTGIFSKSLYGNDAITPVGTFYQFQFSDDRNSVVQTACYQIVGAGTVDLSNLNPYIPIPPAPVVIYNIIAIPYSANIVIPLNFGNTFEITLTGDTTITFTGGWPGQKEITLIIHQDNVGGHVVTWGANFKGGVPCGLVANKASIFDYVFNGTYCYLTGLPVLDQ